MRKKKREFTAKEVTSLITKKYGLLSNSTQSTIYKAIEKVLGPEAMHQIIHTAISENTIILRTSSPLLRTELHQHRSEILFRLNEMLSDKEFNDLQVL
ncbi:DciA family protein [Planobacterium oryzisoli]|uniref:DUF721 domain-containing protein n=1 Tax=Planobacterium oryzisoli TaxID=2771435 RepID=A0A931E9K8_9FLAO|nr:DciA family protein [Planobacterium oryzisoli]MBF5026693.1 DUF721 domain-containing protein [Planobacterium oryzisoli]